MSEKVKETPLMKQYNHIKKKHPDAILLFRVGDFYETFGEDAIKSSKILEIVLTKRANGSASHIELAGFPHHALDTYLPKLIRAGYRVAICDQLEDPKMVKGIVKRGVTELVTPGLSLNDNVLERGKNNYLASIFYDKDINGIAFLDLSTGEFFVAHGDNSYIEKLIQGFQPSEIISNKENKEKIEALFSNDYNTFFLDNWFYTFDFGYENLIKHFRTSSLKGFGIESLHQAIISAGAVLHYLKETEHLQINHISKISRLEEENFMWLDSFTIKNLEILSTYQNDGIPLINILNQVLTPMGSRMLRKWIILPLKNKIEIEKRLKVVEALFSNKELALKIQDQLKHISDLERLVSKIATARINPREFIQLKKSLTHIVKINHLLDECPTLSHYKNQLESCTAFIDYIEKYIVEDPPLNVSLGNFIKEGIDENLDELRKIAFSGKDYLLQIQQKEILNTGISSLKIAYNKVFGYYLEVTNVHKNKVPQNWIRKQTLVNAERYITEELKVYEEKILNAESEISIIENRIYNEILSYSKDYIEIIQQNAKIIANIDCLVNFAMLSIQNKYTKPHFNENNIIDIKNGRHPVIEHLLKIDEVYIPNDLYLDTVSQQILVITGPNMSGKSAFLKQTALIVLMAQMGCYVPAEHADISITDKIFTRVGASDNLSRGESTFMVEMIETASILNNLSPQSLVIMDEIGRGTSTYDGISIAWSIIEYLHNHPTIQPKTLFASHYHELNELEKLLPRVKNYNVSIKELNDKIIFLRKLQKGGSEHSFGIHVASMAGIPSLVIKRANDILKVLEKEKIHDTKKDKLENLKTEQFKLNVYYQDEKIKKLIETLNSIVIETLTPVEAFLKINELKDLMKMNKNSE